MREFIFGTLATTGKRVAHAQEQRRGVRHRQRLEPRAPHPGDAPVITVTVETDEVIERIVCVLQEPETAVIPLYPAKTEWDLLNWRYCQVWQATLPSWPQGTVVRYRIEAQPAAGGSPILADEGATFSYQVDEHIPPAWAAEAIVYQIFPDRFYPGNGCSWNPTRRLSDIYGGTLRGIIDKLDYVADLGFNCIWLNPFFPDDTHHGYHATDYFTVNPRLGTLDDIRELVDAAHAKDIRLLLDFVANHWGRQHLTFQAALADRHSPYYSWYHWQEWPHKYKTFFGVQALPQVNVDDPAARDYLLRSARFWLQEIGFDGLRLDYMLGPSHDFWTDLRALAKEVRPDAWLFGEVVESPVTQLSYEGRVDGCLDFLLAQAMRNTFALGVMDVAAFDAFLAGHDAFFPPHFSRPSFLDNHDMNRFLWLVGGDKRRLKLAALCQFTLAGPPIVYNGTEVGVRQEHDMADSAGQGMEECRQPMLWGDEQDSDLHAFYKWLIHLRRRHPALRHGRHRTIHVDATAATYAYTRSDEKETLVVGLNLSEEERRLETAVYTFTLPPYSGKVQVIG